ncbi:MAG: cob(I)yrinic acid a,c-diamide adenosyltransferase [Pseudomonadota bacterium]|jgi:cob(I)alamin adenosyltransferase|nr:cob(I)yrinic acid a,c-diamide adenosyltransferase [Alphaproteobacteria bacterium]
MVKLNKIYTKTGDKGDTGLGDGSRVRKYDLRVAAYGTVDETNAVIGIVRLHSKGSVDAALARIQNDLFDLGADLCTPESEGEDKETALRISDAQVERLENEIDVLNARLKPLNSFILPGGGAVAAFLHLARTVSRRAERQMVKLAEKEKVNPAALRYINRLSDFLFVLGRHANDDGAADILWKPGQNL